MLLLHGCGLLLQVPSNGVSKYYSDWEKGYLKADFREERERCIIKKPPTLITDWS